MLATSLLLHEDSGWKESPKSRLDDGELGFEEIFPEAFKVYRIYHISSMQPHQIMGQNLLDGQPSNSHLRSFQLDDQLVDPPNSLEHSFPGTLAPLTTLPSQHFPVSGEVHSGAYSGISTQDDSQILGTLGGPLEIGAFHLSDLFIPHATTSPSMAYPGTLANFSPFHQYGDSEIFNHNIDLSSQYVMGGLPKEVQSSTTVTTQDMSRSISTASTYASRNSELAMDPVQLHLNLLQHQHQQQPSLDFRPFEQQQDHGYSDMHSHFEGLMQNTVPVSHEYPDLSSGVSIAPHPRSEQRRNSDSEEPTTKDDGIALQFDIQEEGIPLLYRNANGDFIPLSVHIQGITERTVVPVKKKEPEQGVDHVFYRRNYVGATACFTIDVDHAGPLYVQLNGIIHQVQATSVTLACQIGQDEGTSVELRLYNTKRKKINAPPVHRIKTWPKVAITSADSDSSSRVVLPLQEDIQAGGVRPTSAIFERLQFCRATQHNGQRRSNQQYFVLRLDCQADIGTINSNGSRQERWVTVHTAKTIDVVVRGRSPGHYNPVKKAAKKAKARLKASEKQNRHGHAAGALRGRMSGYHARQAAMQQQQRLVTNYGSRDDLTRQPQRGRGRGRRGGATFHQSQAPSQWHETSHAFAISDANSLDNSMFDMSQAQFLWPS